MPRTACHSCPGTCSEPENQTSPCPERKAPCPPDGRLQPMDPCAACCLTELLAVGPGSPAPHPPDDRLKQVLTHHRLVVLGDLVVGAALCRINTTPWCTACVSHRAGTVALPAAGAGGQLGCVRAAALSSSILLSELLEVPLPCCSPPALQAPPAWASACAAVHVLLGALSMPASQARWHSQCMRETAPAPLPPKPRLQNPSWLRVAPTAQTLTRQVPAAPGEVLEGDRRYLPH